MSSLNTLNTLTSSHILFFDGECIFCDTWVRILYRWDYKKKFTFCALQSETAQSILGEEVSQNLSTVILYDSNSQRKYIRSAAILRALALANPVFLILLIFLLIPSAIRDSIYCWIAKNRYRFFGKKELCAVDPSLDRSRFILK